MKFIHLKQNIHRSQLNGHIHLIKPKPKSSKDNSTKIFSFHQIFNVSFSETGYFCALQSGPKGCNVCLCSSCFQVYETSLCFKDCKADNFLLLQKVMEEIKREMQKDILQSFPQINHILSVEMLAILKIMYSNVVNITQRMLFSTILQLNICYNSLAP